MTAGSGAHKGREINLRQKIESHEDLPFEDCQDASRDYVNNSFDTKEVQVEQEFDGKSKEDAKGITVDLAVEITRKDREIFQPEIQPVQVERSLAVEYPEMSRIIVGTIDAEEGGEVVRDLKSGKRAYGQSKADDSMALSTYGVLLTATSGKMPSEYLIDNVVASGKSPVKTGAYRTTRTKEQLERQLRRFASWLKVVDSGMFAPCNPEHFKCCPQWCGYWPRCPYGGGK